MLTTRIHIDQLARIADTAHLARTLQVLPGVETVEIDPRTEQAVLQHRYSVDPQTLSTAVRQLGYSGTLL